MTNRNHAKGARTEREISELLTNLTGFAVRRKLGAGRIDDEGDLEGLPEVTVQVAAWNDALRAVRQKPLEAEQQRINAGNPLVVTFVKLQRAGWRAVMTPEQWATWMRRVRPAQLCVECGDDTPMDGSPLCLECMEAWR